MLGRSRWTPLGLEGKAVHTQEVDNEAGHAHEGLLGLCSPFVSYCSAAGQEMALTHGRPLPSAVRPFCMVFVMKKVNGVEMDVDG